MAQAIPLIANAAGPKSLAIRPALLSARDCRSDVGFGPATVLSDFEDLFIAAPSVVSVNSSHMCCYPIALSSDGRVHAIGGAGTVNLHRRGLHIPPTGGRCSHTAMIACPSKLGTVRFYFDDAVDRGGHRTYGIIVSREFYLSASGMRAPLGESERFHPSFNS